MKWKEGNQITPNTGESQSNQFAQDRWREATEQMNPVRRRQRPSQQKEDDEMLDSKHMSEDSVDINKDEIRSLIANVKK